MFASKASGHRHNKLVRFKIGKLWVGIETIVVLVVTIRPKFITVDYFSYYKTLQLFTSITKQKLSTKVIKIVNLGGLGLSMFNSREREIERERE
jgi:hypothetical protein